MEPEHVNLLPLFEEEGVAYLIIGGYAVITHITHGYPRFTEDLNLLIQASQANGERAVRALERFGRPVGEFEPDAFARTQSFISFATSKAWVDLMTQVPGIDLAASFANRKATIMQGMSLKFINLAHLRLPKQATGRLKDVLDLENLPPA